MIRFASWFCVFLFAALQAGAAVVPDRYIVELEGAPAALHAVRLGHRAHPADPEFRARLTILREQHAQMRKALEARGAQVLGETSVVANLMFVNISSDRAGQLASVPGVVRVRPQRLYYLNLDHALPLEKVPDAWAQIGGPDHAGAGIKVAVIDTGIDSRHPAFNDPALTPPPGFPITGKPSDSAYTNNKIIVARSYSTNRGVPGTSPAIDAQGHGTGVAMIVGGATVTGPNGTITGIAPKAFLGNYKVFPDDPNAGASDSAIISAIEDAVADNMDILTLSLGSVPAPRPGDDFLVQAVQGAIVSGKIVTIAAGNAGPSPNTIGSPGTAPDAISVGSRPNDRVFSGSIQVAGLPPIVAVPGSGPNSPVPISGPLADVAQFDPTGMACGALPPGSLSGSIALILRGVCLFSDKLNNAQQAGAVAAIVYNDAARSDVFGMDVGAATLPATGVSYADGTALQQLAAAGPAAATLVFTLGPIAVGVNRLTGFSSRGPNTDNGIKPDLIAVGENVSTATLNGGFVVESGTSFSTPMVAGAAALIEAARPGLSAQQYRSLLVNSATPVTLDSGALLTIQQQGAGFLNVLSALNNTVTANPASLNFGAGSGTVDQTTTLALTNVGTASDTFSITIQPIGNGPTPMLSANTVQLDPGQSQNVSVEFLGASLDPGAYQGYLQIQGTQTQVIAMVPYWYGVPSNTGFNVTVLQAPSNGSPNTRQTLFVRPTDRQGLPITDPPTVTATSGGGSVISTQSIDSDFPGVYTVTVRLGPFAGANVFRIASGDASTSVTIQSP